VKRPEGGIKLTASRDQSKQREGKNGLWERGELIKARER